MGDLISFKKTKKIDVKAKSGTTAEIYIYADIAPDFWGEGWSVGARELKAALDNLDKAVNRIELHINSPGGDVFEGITMYNLLKNHGAKIVTYIDSMAYSIASVIAMAGDEIIFSQGALMMIHKPWTVARGNSRDLEDTMDHLDLVEDQLIGIYQKRTGLSSIELKQMLAAETFFDADQAIDAGFADRKAEDEETRQVAACDTSHASWINKMPTMKTNNDIAKEKTNNFLSEINNFSKDF